MEVKSGEGTVVVADHNRYSDECCNNRGWGSGWGASVVQALGNKTA